MLLSDSVFILFISLVPTKEKLTNKTVIKIIHHAMS